MSICSFISDEGGENSQSYMEFSVDTSNILHTDNISSFSSPLACLNLKKLQTLLFQTNYYLKKLEEKMNETQRTFDIEVPLRQLRSHQTVLSLKINSETVDDAFMNFVTEKHSRIMDEIKKVLAEKPEITSVSKVTQVSVFENTEIISNQNTPAFSSGKSFIFRDCDNIDKQLSVKIEEIFAKFVSVDSVEESLETLNQNFFRLQFPKISDVIKKFLVSVQNFRQYRKKNRFDSVINKINENSENLNENVAKEVKKTLALQELHLNLSNLKKRNQANSESFTQTDDSCSSTEQSTRINSLELQLKNLQDILSAIKKEKETIEKYQEVLVNKISKTKNPEKTIFFKERYEKTTELLLKTQESLNKLTTQNNLIQKASEKKLNYINSIINTSRFELSSLIKSLEKSRLEITPVILNDYISRLHTISLNLIIRDQDIPIDKNLGLNKLDKEALETRKEIKSKNLTISASDKLDLYLLQRLQ